MQQAGALVEPRYLSLWFPSFSDRFFPHFRKLSQLLEMLNMLNMHIRPFGKNLAFKFIPIIDMKELVKYVFQPPK